ncbi:unnamed protein product, partial [Protopolystoma xenopodis]
MMLCERGSMLSHISVDTDLLFSMPVKSVSVGSWGSYRIAISARYRHAVQLPFQPLNSSHVLTDTDAFNYLSLCAGKTHHIPPRSSPSTLYTNRSTLLSESSSC